MTEEINQPELILSKDISQGCKFVHLCNFVHKVGEGGIAHTAGIGT